MPSRRRGALSSALLVAANILIPASILIFGAGFFPYKPLLPGFADYSDAGLQYYGQDAVPAKFDKLVFMVVDALRSDFVYTAESGFKFTQSLMREGAAFPFTAHATSPTVTMPRLKAITTGSIPSFLDVVLNLNEGDESASLASQDTWLAQMKRKNTGKLVMYGDDTWLKLFPGTFDRAEGTTSFFVSDFTEVDNNVTRHIPDELKRDDWNAMVLHYLGLDHIGHKGGPRSPHMIPKQREMDQVIKQIYTAIETEEHLGSTLFVVCGDHGMNDAGNHGASSAGETSPALVFMSPRLKQIRTIFQAPLPEDEEFEYYTLVEQSDIAPTLAALLGFPVPKNNLGALIPDLLPFWSDKEQAQLLMQNAGQIMKVAGAAFGDQTLESIQGDDGRSPTDAQQLAKQFLSFQAGYKEKVDKDADSSDMVTPILKWLRNSQSFLSGMASNYNTPRMLLGQAASIAALALAIFAAAYSVNDTSTSFTPFALTLTTYAIMMFASSYVEEEHHFWYWATTAWFGYLGLRGLKRTSSSPTIQTLSTTALLLVTRLIRSWNQTGQKFAGEPDVVKLFLRTNPVLLWSLVILTYLWIHQSLVYGFSGLPIWLSFAAATGLVLAAFTFKVAFTLEDAPEIVTDPIKKVLELSFTTTTTTTTQGAVDLISRARAVFIGVGLLTGTTLLFMLSRRRISLGQPGTYTLLTLLTLILVTQSRTTSIPLLMLSNLQFRLLLHQLEGLSPVEISLSALLLQYSSFFAFGGTNAISSVDLSSAYNGVAEYSAVSVGVLTFISNWSGPVWWMLASTILLLSKREELLRVKSREAKEEEEEEKGGGGIQNLWKGHVAVLTVFAAGSVAAVMAACAVLRTHLFVWTVFSPKYLYVVAWSLGQHLVVNVLVGGLFYWLGVVEGIS
ncbi:GPI ethanolamine phosphate transferase 2 [Cladorrhinum sp. PSN332]|nr:GPI ethanolamine phosphate transferase 2 [Cladorrhinum sp. PSN332]